MLIQKKLLSAFMVVFLFSTFLMAGCNSHKRVGPTIEEGTPWYDVEELVLGNEYLGYDYVNEYINVRVAGKIDDDYVYWVQADCNSENGDSFLLQKVALYDEAGGFITDVDLGLALQNIYDNNEVHPYVDFYNSYFYRNEFYVGGYNSADSSYYEYKVNFDSGSLIESRVISNVPEKWDWDNLYTLYFGSCGDYRIIIGDPLDDDVNAPVYHITKPDGDVSILKLNDFFSDSNFAYPPNPIFVDENKMFLGFEFDSNREAKCAYVLDAELEEIVSMTPESDPWLFEWVISDTGDYFVRDQGGSGYAVSSLGLTKIDFENNEFLEVVEFNNVNYNRQYFIDGATLLYQSESEIEFARSTLNIFDTTSKIYILRKSDNNPNVGKIIITTDGWGADVFEAIRLFNNSNSEYFMCLVKSYESFDMYLNDYSDASYRAAKDEFGNRLASDLVSEECPDVVFYTSTFPQLSSEEYMLDLSDYYSNSVLKNQLYTNIIDASMSDGKLFRIPVSFFVEGILVDSREYSDNQIGLTYEEFADFTINVMNGDNVIGRSKLKYLMNSVPQIYRDLFADGDIDFDCESFRQLAMYTHDNVTSCNESFLYRNTEFGSLGEYFDNLYWSFLPKNESTILGYPSVDRRGPAFSTYSAVSITKGCLNPDGAWLFIETLLGVDVQTFKTSPTGFYGISSGIGFPINRVCYQNMIDDFVSIYNDHISSQMMIANGRVNSSRLVEREDIESFEEIILSIDHESISDSAIDIVIFEEIQPYLEDDKTLDEVIIIMNDRARTLLDERG